MWGRKEPLHSRKWEPNLALLRRSFAKLSDTAQSDFLRADLPELIAFALQAGWQDSDMRLLRPEYVMPLLDAVQSFFEQSLRSIDMPKEGLVLPRELVYHQANVFPPSVLADGQPLDEDSVEKLMPIAKACKLDKEQRPKDTRDPRRANRVLHLCMACSAYKQPTEFYVCCLHDTLRCCRECMLVRAHSPTARAARRRCDSLARCFSAASLGLLLFCALPVSSRPRVYMASC